MLCSVNGVNLPFVYFESYGRPATTAPQFVEGVGNVAVTAAWMNGDTYYDGLFRSFRETIQVTFIVDNVESNYMVIKNTKSENLESFIDPAFSEKGEDGREYYCWNPSK